VSKFQKDKILKLIKAICARARETDGYVNKTKLIKYLYLIDVEYYRRHRETFTELNWIFYDFGPWAYEYNEIFDEMLNSPDFDIKEGDRADLDTQFISTSDKIELDSIFESFEDELITKRIIDKWSVENLNSMLNYVYFKTEPMVEAERYKPLDFKKIHTLEEIPEFELTRGIKTKHEKEIIRKEIKRRLESLRKVTQQDKTFTRPSYDDVYAEGMEHMDKDDEY
jgi:hypothetical protein